MSYLVLDVGGSGIKYALMNEHYEFLEKGKIETCYQNQEEFIETIGKLYDYYASRIEGIALSYCGELDPDSGYLYTGGSLFFNTHTNIKEALKKRCPVRIEIENDGNCAALAELYNGCLKDCKNALTLVLGTGIAGAIIIDRKIYHGSHFYSGSASFLMHDVKETFSMGSIFARINGIHGLYKPYEAKKNLPKNSIDGVSFFEAIYQKDEDAINQLNTYCNSLANMIYNLQLILDVDCIAIGGGISVQPLLIETLKKHIDSIYEHNPIPLPKAKVDVCKHHNDANLIGALYHYKNKTLH